MSTQARLSVINTSNWIKENESSFLPPVCNKLMHNGQLVIMFVGGPNNREDYHIEEGEELFYQIKGDACVKILENGVHKDVHIREGEFFLLPAKIPHSPQRSTDSCGLVIERRRDLSETDCVRWFVPSTSDVLYEKWFHCKDLGVELIPLIKGYFASEEYKTKQPGSNVLDPAKVPFKLNQSVLSEQKHGPYNLLEKITTTAATSELALKEMNLQFQVSILRKGQHVFSNLDGIDQWLWQLKGTGNVTLGSDQMAYSMTTYDSLLVPDNYCKEMKIEVLGDDDFILKITQNPAFKV